MRQRPDTKGGLRVVLPLELIQALKREAEDGPTLISIVESALREHVIRRELAQSKKKGRSVQNLDRQR